MAAAALAPAALSIVLPRSRARTAGICALQMWAYLAAYELPHDDPEALAGRVLVDYPIVVDKALGFGTTPTQRLQHAFAKPGEIGVGARLLVWCHWLWFVVPHGTVAYILWRDPEAAAGAAARLYAVFDLGAIVYWTAPTAPPWWAAEHGRLGPEPQLPVRRMMIEYGEQFWGARWNELHAGLGGNPLAAMPSLHFASTLMVAHLLSETGPVAGALGWSYLALLGTALVYLGEHYVVDLIAGAALAESVYRGARFAAPLARRLARGLQALNRLATGA